MALKFGLLALLEAIPKALAQVGSDLLAADPDIRSVEVVAVT